MRLIGVDAMAEGLKEYFKDYNGCRNCKFQPEPMQMCEWRKHRTVVELICSGWERRVRKESDDSRY